MEALRLLSEGQEEADRIKTPDNLLDWIEAHREKVGLAAFPVGREAEGVFLNADQPFALASTKKVLILGAYAEAVRAGRLREEERVRVADVERWYWPGTDGGAHEQAVAEWRDRKRTQSAGAAETVPLDAVAHAMIRWSDNAATDYLLERTGGPEAVARFARARGMARQESLSSIFGTTVAWAMLPADAWLKLRPEEQQRRAAELARITPAATAKTLRLPGLAEQKRLARVSDAGTPREWARLMAQVQSGRGLETKVADVMRRHLEWPLQAFDANRKRFDAFGTKGGSLFGLVTEASYLKAKGKPPIAVALFFRDLPGAVWQTFQRTFPQQKFVVRLAEDPAFFQAVRRRLGADR